MSSNKQSCSGPNPHNRAKHSKLASGFSHMPLNRTWLCGGAGFNKPLFVRKLITSWGEIERDKISDVSEECSDAAGAKRGKLRIYFGMQLCIWHCKTLLSPGVSSHIRLFGAKLNGHLCGPLTPWERPILPTLEAA